MPTCAIALSGGVDSTVAAKLLLQQKYHVIGITLITQESTKTLHINNVSQVADQLGIKVYFLDVIKQFNKEVIDYFINSYKSGLTPNPCAICNRKVKIGLLVPFAKELGADFLATGHYANLHVNNNLVYLQEANNIQKDQTYFLSLVENKHLQYLKFPLSDIQNKETVRELAYQFNLKNYNQKDSQDICFIETNYISFLKKYLELPPGDIILQNKKIGQHLGLANYTIGQRKGLGIASNHPLYVIDFNVKKNQLIVGTQDKLIKTDFTVKNINWILPVKKEFTCMVKIRSGSRKFSARISILQKEVNVHLLEVNNIAICPGQVCAFYQENTVLGGGIIE